MDNQTEDRGGGPLRLVLNRRIVLGGLAAMAPAGAALAKGKTMVKGMASHTLRTARQTTAYIELGPEKGPLMIFLHGWPEINLVWRAQMEAFAAQGWRCVAPDMRGYGGSSAPADPKAYAMSEIVTDMLELHDHLGGKPAVWIGHDLGSPVCGALAAHHPSRCRGVVFVSVPYYPKAFALPVLVSLVDRNLYPADKYPNGQWDYYAFYQTNFETTVSDFDADIPATLASVFRRGGPSIVGKVSPTAMVTANDGRYGAAHRAPPTQPDPTLWPDPDFAVLVAAYRVHGFRPVNAWYLNDAENMAYAAAAPDGGRLNMPVLFINGDWDPICDITRNAQGEPMKAACPDFSMTNVEAGHWVPLERKPETIEAIGSWLKAKALQPVA